LNLERLPLKQNHPLLSSIFSDIISDADIFFAAMPGIAPDNLDKNA
jgi:hypothetical protein